MDALRAAQPPAGPAQRPHDRACPSRNRPALIVTSLPHSHLQTHMPLPA